MNTVDTAQATPEIGADIDIEELSPTSAKACTSSVATVSSFSVI